MTGTLADEVPRPLIETLFNSDRSTNGRPQLPPQQRDEAIRWLRRSLIDFDALDRHIALLQELYKASFRYPRPRRDCWTVEQLAIPDEPTQFSHPGRLTDDRITVVMDRGVAALNDTEIATLLLSPFALYDLYDVIDDLSPEGWIEDVHRVATAMQSSTDVSPIGSAFTAQAPLPSGGATAKLADDFWARLERSLTSALRQSQSVGSTPATTAASAAQRSSATFSRYAIVTTALACAASLAAVWVAVQATNYERAIHTQLAMLTGNAQGPDGTGIALHSAPMRAPSLKELLRYGFLNLDVAERSPKDAKEALDELTSAASPELRALIDELRARKLEPLDIIKHLRSLVESTKKEEQQ